MTKPTRTRAGGEPPATSARDSAGRPSHGHAQQAARTVRDTESVRIPLPLLNRLELPPGKQLAFLAGMGVLAVAGAIEWPVAILVGVGHSLVSQSHNKALEDFGEALDEA